MKQEAREPKTLKLHVGHVQSPGRVVADGPPTLCAGGWAENLLLALRSGTGLRLLLRLRARPDCFGGERERAAATRGGLSLRSRPRPRARDLLCDLDEDMFAGEQINVKSIGLPFLEAFHLDCSSLLSCVNSSLNYPILSSIKSSF